MFIGSSRPAAILAALALVAGGAQAASISYYLDQSNAENIWPDGVNYLQVTISDSVTHPGDIEFLVVPLFPLTSSATGNFGIMRFGFNTTGAGDALVASNVIDPAGWATNANSLMGDFGAYEIREDTTGCCRQNPLSFRITGISGDTIYDYAVAGTGGSQGAYYFAAQVGGMSTGSAGSGHFAGGTPVVNQVVPVPAAAWLLISALAGLCPIHRRLR